MSYSSVKKYEKAIEILNQCLSINPEYLPPYFTLTACYIELNDFDKAQKAARKILELDPNFSLEYHKEVLPVKNKHELERYIGNLRKAGLPE